MSPNATRIIKGAIELEREFDEIADSSPFTCVMRHDTGEVVRRIEKPNSYVGYLSGLWIVGRIGLDWSEWVDGGCLSVR